MPRPPVLPPPIVERICRRIAEGATLRAIAAELDADGVQTGHGAPRWTPGTVSSVSYSKRGQAVMRDLL